MYGGGGGWGALEWLMWSYVNVAQVIGWDYEFPQGEQQFGIKGKGTLGYGVGVVGGEG